MSGDDPQNRGSGRAQVARRRRPAPGAVTQLDAYGVLPAKMRVDAQHIAIATVGRVDVLVSWNFKHIVNLRRIHGYNSVNLRRGYPMIEIRTPREVLSDE